MEIDVPIAQVGGKGELNVLLPICSDAYLVIVADAVPPAAPLPGVPVLPQGAFGQSARVARDPGTYKSANVIHLRRH